MRTRTKTPVVAVIAGVVGVVLGLGIATIINYTTALDFLEYAQALPATRDCEIEWDGWRKGWDVYCEMWEY